MNIWTVNTRFGKREVKVNTDKLTRGEISFSPDGRWYTATTSSTSNSVLVENRQTGRFVGEIVQTVKGKQIVFAHNGHAYAAGNVVTAFSKLAWSEL